MYEIFSDVPPNQNSGAAPVQSIYILYIYVFTCAPPQIFIRGGPHGSCSIEDRNLDLMSYNFENEGSAKALETGIVSRAVDRL